MFFKYNFLACLHYLFFSGIKEQQELFEAIEMNDYSKVQDITENDPQRNKIYRFNNKKDDVIIYEASYDMEKLAVSLTNHIPSRQSQRKNQSEEVSR